MVVLSQVAPTSEYVAQGFTALMLSLALGLGLGLLAAGAALVVRRFTGRKGGIPT